MVNQAGPALAVRSIVDALRAEIQNRILRGTIAPGTLLAEGTVAQTFDVARPTAKAAIEQLVHVGLLRRSHNKTARVPLLDEADIADVYFSRGAIEQAAVGLLTERREVPRGAQEALNRLQAALASADSAEVVESDIAFHRELIAAAGSPRLLRLHEAVIGEAHLCMAQVQLQHLLDPKVIANEHKRILTTIKSGDTARASREMGAHLARAQKKLLEYMRQQQAAAAEG